MPIKIYNSTLCAVPSTNSKKHYIAMLHTKIIIETFAYLNLIPVAYTQAQHQNTIVCH